MPALISIARHIQLKGFETMKPLCIYHGNCADGFGAAWAVRHALGDNVDFHAGVYQQDPPDVTGRRVILVDFSYKRSVLEGMAEKAQSVLVLDHHKTAAADLEGYPDPPVPLPGMRGWLPDKGVWATFDMERSGAMIAWDHFNLTTPPMLLKHIEDRDLWRFKLDGTREIQAALFSYPYDFEVWDKLMGMDPQQLRRDGEAIERKHFKDIREFIAAAGHRMTIAGHDVPALNAPYFWSSDAGHIMAQGEPFAACYWDTADGRIFSLRSAEDGLDVSEIAKQFGGGGHKHAAGYKVVA
jgi:oligoribonuclease NrnB/cAMP/cGMP phosphodiesterase (DHH superfamily)